MICGSCRLGAEYNNLGEYEPARRYHDECLGPGCACQHGTGPGWVAR